MEPQIRPPSPDELPPLELPPLDPAVLLLAPLPNELLLEAVVPLEELAVAELLPDLPLEPPPGPPTAVELWRQPWQPPGSSDTVADEVGWKQPAAARNDSQQSSGLTCRVSRRGSSESNPALAQGNVVLQRP